MRSRATALGLAAFSAAVVTGISAASASPYLRSVAASRGHVVAVFTLDGADTEELTPGRIAVAAKATIQADGSFVSTNVRVQETLSSVTRVTNGYRYRTLHRLRPGRYYVKVSGKVIGLDCTPHKPCPELWSNARRVVIPRP